MIYTNKKEIEAVQQRVKISFINYIKRLVKKVLFCSNINKILDINQQTVSMDTEKSS